MKAPRKKTPARRKPKQLRAMQTVEAVLDAVARVLKRDGVASLTTNRVASAAGVSIGSVYQYFPDKDAILIALRDRHVEQMARLVEAKLIERAEGSLGELIAGLVDAMVEAHAIDPGLYQLLLSQLPHDPQGDREFEVRLRGALRLAISARAYEFERRPDLERILFVLTQMLEALAHGVVLRRPASLSLREAKQEAVLAVLAYLHAHGKIERPTAKVRSTAARTASKRRGRRRPPPR